ncbi:SWR1-complex protein 4 [Drosophila obscura]|uniref:SWR1-complex protein 4 n=1 Tax=Drosophila obscura TaxID=7282 RepID=UPI001BB27A4A|nr:SWR1-complex protein 4 [Drosophila obscura]
MMSMSNLSVDGEFRYIIQWFHEWSELQRDDFVYVFVEYLTRGSSADVGGVHVNGVVNALATAGVQDKPMSLFQCRIKLFREWSPKWPIEFKCQLQEKINEIDSKVGEKIINELKGHHGGGVHNGDVAVHLNENGAAAGEEIELEQPAAVAAALPTVPTPAAAAADVAPPEVPAPSQAVEVEADNDNHLAAVLRQETPVDDDDDEVGDYNEQRASAGDDCNADVNGHYLSASVTTIAVNTSPSTSPSPSPQPSVEPVEQVENNVTVSVAVAAADVVPPVA